MMVPEHQSICYLCKCRYYSYLLIAKSCQATVYCYSYHGKACLLTHPQLCLLLCGSAHGPSPDPFHLHTGGAHHKSSCSDDKYHKHIYFNLFLNYSLQTAPRIPHTHLLHPSLSGHASSSAFSFPSASMQDERVLFYVGHY